jgi:hypothetical protein
LTGRYVTPDIIAGSWELSFGNRRGSFELGRLGQDTGTFRFVGKIFNFRQEGVIALSLDDNVVTGEVYEVLRGRSAQISGSVDGAVMSLTTTGEIATSATGTVTYDQDGAPTGVSGVWSTNGEFKLAACRLN